MAYAFIWNEKRKFLVLSCVPFALMLLVHLLFGGGTLYRYLIDKLDISNLVFTNYFVPPLVAMNGFLNLILFIVFSVVWHRFYLLNSELSAIRNIFLWKKRHFKFLCVVAILGGASWGVILPLQSWSSVHFFEYVSEVSKHNDYPFFLVIGFQLVLHLVSITLAALISARWAVMFPATAVDQFISFKRSWVKTAGNGFRLFAIGILSTFPVTILTSVLLFMLFLWLDTLALQIVKVASYFLNAAIGVSALSISYQYLVDSEGNESLKMVSPPSH